MITETPTIPLSAAEHRQLEQKALAIGVWKEGRLDDALLIVDELLTQDLTGRVAAECYVAQAAFRADRGDFVGSLKSLEEAAPLIDSVDKKFRGSFYHQRA